MYPDIGFSKGPAFQQRPCIVFDKGKGDKGDKLENAQQSKWKKTIWLGRINLRRTKKNFVATLFTKFLPEGERLQYPGKAW